MSFEILHQSKSTVEQVDSPENATELLFDRLSDPNIRKQVVDLILESEVWVKTNVGTYDEPIRGEDGRWKRDELGKMIFNKVPHVVREREEVEADYDKTLERIKSFTEIDFTSSEAQGGDVDDNEKISLNWRLPSGEKPTEKQWAIIEAHEKGHSMRPYRGGFFRDYFSKAFDLKAIGYTPEDDADYLKYRELNSVRMEDDSTFEERKEEFYNYLFSGSEIAERMSQLKNYFGLRGNEQFTLEQLKYAQEHYVEDIGFDNRMTPFLQAITPETEPEFVRLVNCSGI